MVVTLLSSTVGGLNLIGKKNEYLSHSMKESMEDIDLISLVSVSRAILESLPFDSCSK